MENVYICTNLCSPSGITYIELQFINLVVRQSRHRGYTYFILGFAAHKTLSGRVLYFFSNLKYEMNFASKKRYLGIRIFFCGQSILIFL